MWIISKYLKDLAERKAAKKEATRQITLTTALQFLIFDHAFDESKKYGVGEQDKRILFEMLKSPLMGSEMAFKYYYYDHHNINIMSGFVLETLKFIVTLSKQKKAFLPILSDYTEQEFISALDYLMHDIFYAIKRLIRLHDYMHIDSIKQLVNFVMEMKKEMKLEEWRFSGMEISNFESKL